MQENGRFLDDAQRAAALRALEDEFATTLTEAQVLQAARLFFALMSSSALVQRDAVRHEVTRHIADQLAPVLEGEDDHAEEKQETRIP